MDWALAIPRLQALTGKDLWFGSEAGLLSDIIKETFERWFGSSINFTRLYFGQEFCERAIAKNEELERALGISEEKGMMFTYVTPYVTENGLAKVQEQLVLLAGRQSQAEVVINDWGVLDWVFEQQLPLKPVLGRLLNKILRDPRMPKGLRGSPKTNKIQYLQTSYLAGLGMKKLLKQYNVRRIELDNPPQGLDPDLSDWGYESSLYLPFGVVTTGRICLIQSWGLESKDKFRSSSRCEQKCKYYWLEMSDRSGQVRKSVDWKIMQKGNTIFYRQSSQFVAKALKQAEAAGVNRIVFQPEPL